MTDTPDEVLTRIYKSISGPLEDPSALKGLMTKTGWDIWQWLVVQPWLKERPEPAVLDRKEEGHRYERIELYEFPDRSQEKVGVIFFREDGQWKFHDVFLFEMKGKQFNLHLSYVLNEPIKTNMTLWLQNPSWPTDPPPPWFWQHLNGWND
jgi:hypothetical protein